MRPFLIEFLKRLEVAVPPPPGCHHAVMLRYAPDDARWNYCLALQLNVDGKFHQFFIGPEDDSASAELLAANVWTSFLRAENGRLRQAVLNQRGDDLCHLDKQTLADVTSGKVQPPPRAEFLKSCERFIDQISNERSSLTGCMTIAQLEAEVERLRMALSVAHKEIGWLRRHTLKPDG